MPMVWTAAAILAAYLLGSVSFAVVVSQAFGLADPRTYGSKNPGATNVLRSGSKPAAEQRQNVFFIGDDHAVLPTVEPVYRTLAKQLLPIGRIGQASAIKLSFNLLIANLNQAMIESLELARRSGIDPAAWFNALDYNVAKSGLADLKKPKLLTGDFSPQFSIKHMHKDLRLALRHAASLGLRLDETAAVERAYAAAAEQGLGELDFSALLKVVREGL